MYTGHILEHLRNADPARKDGDIRNETDVAHQLITRGPRIAPQNFQVALILREPQNRVQCGALPCPIGTDQTQDAAFFDMQVYPVEGNG